MVIVQMVVIQLMHVIRLALEWDAIKTMNISRHSVTGNVHHRRYVPHSYLFGSLLHSLPRPQLSSVPPGFHEWACAFPLFVYGFFPVHFKHFTNWLFCFPFSNHQSSIIHVIYYMLNRKLSSSSPSLLHQFIFGNDYQMWRLWGVNCFLYWKLQST